MKRHIFVVLGVIVLIGLKATPVSLGQTASIQVPSDTGEFIVQTIIKRIKENDAN